MNPNQEPWDNLEEAAASRVVGGMSSHWTCCTPVPDELELPKEYRADTFDAEIREAKELVKTNDTVFDNMKSIRHELVKKTLNAAFSDKGKSFKSMPLACEEVRGRNGRHLIRWSSSSTIFGDLVQPNKPEKEDFELWPEHLCTQLVLKHGNNTIDNNIDHALVKDLLTEKITKINAKSYVVCAGAVLTPQLLFMSKIDNTRLPALVRFHENTSPVLRTVW